MKELIYLMVTCIPLLVGAQSNSTYKGIKFEENLSWEQIKAKAKVENKYIFVDCYATWCGPCKKMDQDIYPHWRVGTEMNNKFISVKVQMDTTANDNVHIQSWYATAHKMMRDYKITGLPTFLFFTPDARLVHEELGVKDLAAFIQLTQLACDPQKPLFFGLYQEYQRGKKDYKTMGELAIFTKKLIGDEYWANIIAKDYKKNYLDKLDSATLCTKENFKYILEFPYLINSKDQFFALCYNESEKVNSLRGYPEYFINNTIIREEIENNILQDGKAIKKMPNWRRLESRIKKKYKKVDAKRLIVDYQIGYYRSTFHNWNLWAKYKDKKIKLYPPTPPYSKSMAVVGDLNTFGAWEAFLWCPETTVLKKSLDWIDMAIKLVPENAEYYDTRANLLYKLGRKEEAIPLEEKAVKLDEARAVILKKEPSSDKKETLEKMKRGEPTWPHDQVVSKK